MTTLDEIDAMLSRSAPTEVDHSDASYRVTARELRQFIERAEHLELERKAISDDLRELWAEAKGRGYDVKVMKKVLALRKKNPDEIAEEEAVLEMYREVLGV